jgi:hypothetical protein
VKLSRFEAIVQAYGAAPERWPEDERAQALALSRASITAARMLADGRALDSMLMQAETAAPAPDFPSVTRLKARILVAARTAPARRTVLGWLGLDLQPAQLWPTLAGMTVAVVIGFVAGSVGLLQAGHEFDDVLMTPSAALQVSEADP